MTDLSVLFHLGTDVESENVFVACKTKAEAKEYAIDHGYEFQPKNIKKFRSRLSNPLVLIGQRKFNGNDVIFMDELQALLNVPMKTIQGIAMDCYGDGMAIQKPPSGEHVTSGDLATFNAEQIYAFGSEIMFSSVLDETVRRQGRDCMVGNDVTVNLVVVFDMTKVSEEIAPDNTKGQLF